MGKLSNMLTRPTFYRTDIRGCSVGFCQTLSNLQRVSSDLRLYTRSFQVAKTINGGSVTKWLGLEKSARRGFKSHSDHQARFVSR